jgi:hypothetical protein
VPLDDIAPTRLAADAQPHDADALDAWLDSLAPVDAVNAGHNGHPNGRAPHRREAEASRTAAEGSPLVAIAREFHARFADAEAAHAVDIPETVIWERIMSSQLTMQQPASTSGRPAPQPTRQGADGEPHPTPIVDRFTGGHPAVSAVLAAAVILAIVAIFRVIGAPPSGPGEEPTVASVPNANPGLAASPYASPEAFDCAGPVSVSGASASRPSTYVPVTPVTDPSIVEHANATLTIALECSDPNIPSQPNSIPPIVMTETARERIEAVRATWPVDPWGYAGSFDPKATVLIDIDGRSKSTTIVPGSLFAMPNGRYGAITYQISELSDKQRNGEPFLGLIAVFLSFRPGEGPSEAPLVLTEYVPLCTDESNGTTFCDSAIYPIPTNDQVSTPAASPVASPVVSNDKWLVDPAAAACAVDPANPPGAVDGEWMGSASNAGLLPFSDTTSGNRTAAAEVYLQFRICRDDEVVTDLLVTHAFAEGFAEDSALPPERLARDLALRQEISEAYADREPMSFVIEGEPLPRDFSSPGYGSSSRPVLLPDDVVQLADGRIGGPTHEFFRTNDPGGAASYLAPAGYLETGFVIFAVENGRWVIDEFLPICLGDCDAYWAAREAESTPVTGGPETGDLASLGASGSLIVGDEAQGQSRLVRVPLDGGMPDPLPVGGYSSAIRTAQSDVVILDDAQGNQVAHNVATGITSKTFSTRNIASVANVGPYRIIGYTDPVDLLIVDLRTMRLTMLSDLTGGSIGISNPAFSVQGDESGNLLVGVTRADDPGTTSAMAAFIDGDTGQARILDGWTAPGDSAVVGAIAPDGASIAYPADKNGAVVLRTESVGGEPIRDYAWDAASRIYQMAFVNPTDMVVFSTSPVDGGIAPGVRRRSGYPDRGVPRRCRKPPGTIHLAGRRQRPLRQRRDDRGCRATRLVRAQRRIRSGHGAAGTSGHGHHAQLRGSSRPRAGAFGTIEGCRARGTSRRHVHLLGHIRSWDRQDPNGD